MVCCSTAEKSRCKVGRARKFRVTEIFRRVRAFITRALISPEILKFGQSLAISLLIHAC